MSDSEDGGIGGMNYPLPVDCDMGEEERGEATEIIVTAVEKYPGDYEQLSQFVKEALDKKFGAEFHVVAGRDFSYTVDSEHGHKIALAYGTTAVLAYKAT